MFWCSWQVNLKSARVKCQTFVPFYKYGGKLQDERRTYLLVKKFSHDEILWTSRQQKFGFRGTLRASNVPIYVSNAHFKLGESFSCEFVKALQMT